MHTPWFSQTRDFLLKHAALHIQDDSGIGYSFIKASGRKLALYGEYKHVIPMFRKYLDKELAERYKTDSAKTLPFKIGYSLVYNEANLQILY